MSARRRATARRHSPGGVITCAGCDAIVSRGRVNRLLRAAGDWKCRCGSTSLSFSAAYIQKKDGLGRTTRVLWAHKKRTRKVIVRGKVVARG